MVRTRAASQRQVPEQDQPVQPPNQHEQNPPVRRRGRGRGRGGGRGRGRGRGRGEGRGLQHLQEVNPQIQEYLQQILGELQEHRVHINELLTDKQERRAERQQVERQLVMGDQQADTERVELDQFIDQGEQLERQARSETPPLLERAAIVQPPPIRPEEQHWIIQFSKLKPPAFRGKNDSAEDWLLRLDKIFEVLQCPVDKKARLAIYKLEGDADRWWRNVATGLRVRYTAVTWEVFLKKFNEQYFPPSLQVLKETEFLRIEQGQDESFEEYYARFTSLSRYSLYLKRYDDEKWSSNRLIEGLRDEMREKLVAHEFHRLYQAADACRTIERNLKKIHVSQIKGNPSRSNYSRGESSQKRSAPWTRPQQGSKRPSQQGQRGNPRLPDSRVCPKCGKNHSGSNCDGKPICYYCHKPGHYSRECPQKTAEKRPQSSGRVFALTKEEAKESPEMVQEIPKDSGRCSGSGSKAIQLQ